MSFKNYLKKSMVIVSRFGKRAGRTPGKYIERYTSRLDAAEAMTPYVDPHDLSVYISGYMARKNASDDVISHVASIQQLKDRDEVVTPKSSRLFGNRGLVYSQKDFDEAIATTEKANEDSHTLILPVVSFSYEFLERLNVLKEGTEKAKHKGDYKGLVDQLKLRRAITKGVESLCEKMHFVKPEWTGAIQLDTTNVHCHLTIIETSEDVPNERYVYSPEYETVVDEQSGQSFERKKRDDNGQIVYRNLGERGKLTHQSMDAFRTQVERELTYLKDLQPFVNKTSPHKQLVKEKSLELMLSNTKLVQDVAMIYQALPKGRFLEQDESSLIEAQKDWRAGSRSNDMKQANRLSRSFVRRVLKEHDLAVGFSDYKESVRSYTQFRLPEIVGEDFSKDRARLNHLAIKRLEDELMNGLYRRLKDVRVVESLNSVSNNFNVSIEDVDQPFVDSVDVVKGEVSPLSLRLAALSDTDLKGLICDSYQEDLIRPLNSALTFEHRLREYPNRLSSHLDEVQYYETLKKEFDLAKKENSVSDDAMVLGDFYDRQLDKHERLRDKYLYLMNRGQEPFVEVDNRTYGSFRGDWSKWLMENREILKENELSFKHSISLTTRELVQFEQLPEDVKDFCGRSEFLKRECLMVSRLSQQFESVSKERFDDVKFDDAIYIMYDMDSNVDRQIDSKLLYTSLERTKNDRLVTEQALSYLEQSGQKETAHLAYTKYSTVFQKENEQLDFLNYCMVHGQLPIPVRSSDESKVDVHALSESLTIPSEKSLSLSREFVHFTRDVLEEKETILRRDRQESLDRTQTMMEELIRLNQLHHERSLEENDEEEYDDTLVKAIENVPLNEEIVEVESLKDDVKDVPKRGNYLKAHDVSFI